MPAPTKAQFENTGGEGSTPDFPTTPHVELNSTSETSGAFQPQAGVQESEVEQTQTNGDVATGSSCETHFRVDLVSAGQSPRSEDTAPAPESAGTDTPATSPPVHGEGSDGQQHAETNLSDILDTTMSPEDVARYGLEKHLIDLEADRGK